jgi:hypothetical protein
MKTKQKGQIYKYRVLKQKWVGKNSGKLNFREKLHDIKEFPLRGIHS